MVFGIYRDVPAISRLLRKHSLPYCSVFCVSRRLFGVDGCVHVQMKGLFAMRRLVTAQRMVWIGIVGLCLSVTPWVVAGWADGLEPWSVSTGVGYMGFDSDAQLEGGAAWLLALERKMSDSLSIGGAYCLSPSLNGNEDVAPEIDRSWTASLSVDARWHPVRLNDLEPYLIGGVGMSYFDDRVSVEEYDVMLRIGVGTALYFQDHWSARLDCTMLQPSSDAEASYVVYLGGAYSFGARNRRRSRRFGSASDDPSTSRRSSARKRRVKDVAGPSNTDGGDLDRGLVPWEDAKPVARKPGDIDRAGTVVPVKKAGVPRRTITLDFPYNTMTVAARYFPALDKIARELASDPTVRVRVEGHADKAKGADPVYNKRLSERRAESVRSYLIDVHGIKASRVVVVGFGFERPRVANGPNGNPENRRVDVCTF